MKKDIFAILYMSDKSIPISELQEFFQVEYDELRASLNELKEEQKDSGINVQIKNGFVSLITNPECGEIINNFFNPTLKVKKLSKSSMETLTIIAFKGPMTKSEIEDIKCVSVDGSIQVLLEKKLIVSKERRATVGNPKLYEVSENFYGYIGLDNKDDLFNLDKASWFKELEKNGEEENENK